MTAGTAPPGGIGPPKLRLVTSSEEAAATLANDQAAPLDGETTSLAAPTEDSKSAVTAPSREHAELLRVVEAILFSAPQAMSAQKLAEFLPPGEDPLPLLMELQAHYQGRGVNLVRVAGKWAFRTAADLGYLLKRETVEERRLSKAALETLAIIAYHQPVTRAEIEQIRGVSTSAGTLDILLDTSWIRPRGRRRAPGRPVTYGTTELFLEHFGLDNVADLPGLGELRGAGLLSAQLPPDFLVPQPSDVASLMPDELPLEDDEDEDQADLEFDDAAMDGGEEDGSDDGDDHSGADTSEGVEMAAEDLREVLEADKPEPSSG